MIDDIFSTDVLWQMSLAERAAVLYLLGQMREKKVAIEVGSYRGGFTRVLAERFDVVYSLDIDHSKLWIDPKHYPNLVLVEGNSRDTLPALIAELGDADINFVLIDGDHETGAVIADINSVLTYKPQSEMLVLMHDSWCTTTRAAINHAAWDECPYVHLVEKDFVPGDLMGGSRGNFFVGGLALALLRPDRRYSNIEVRQAQDYMYRICLEGLERRVPC